MIISRTPTRISFFGGGTDYPDWYLENGGAVVSTTINKYSYISPFVNSRLFSLTSTGLDTTSMKRLRH